MKVAGKVGKGRCEVVNSKVWERESLISTRKEHKDINSIRKTAYICSCRG